MVNTPRDTVPSIMPARKPGMRGRERELPLVMAQSEITRASVGLRSERGPVLGSIMLSVGLIAIDATILATAVPSIVNDLGGFSQFPWLFSIFLLTQAVSVPIYAKFSDHVRPQADHAASASRCSCSPRCCAAWPGACPP